VRDPDLVLIRMTARSPGQQDGKSLADRYFFAATTISNRNGKPGDARR
jgi:hypothetical protein